MRILIVTQYIYPETFKSSDMAFELSKRGHVVEVLTGIPNYPQGHYYDGYGIFRKRIEKKNGVTFYRCFQTPRKLFPSILGLSLNYISFVISASLWVILYFIFKKKYDVIITHEPSPITQILPAILLGKIKKTPVVSWIMDIWPDSVTDVVGKKTKSILVPPLRYLTNIVYKHSNLLLITSQGFKELINREGDYSDKIIYYPNWSYDMMESSHEYKLPYLPDGFIIMVAGNLGESQNLDAVANTIIELKDEKELKWVFVGNGSRKDWLEHFVTINNLSDKVFIVGQHPPYAMPHFFRKANAMLVSLSPGYKFLDATVPARLQSYMSAGRPILGMLGSGGSEIINDSDCGYAVAPGNSHELAMTIRDKVLKDKEAFETKGLNGRSYFEKNYKLSLCIDNLESIIKKYFDTNTNHSCN